MTVARSAASNGHKSCQSRRRCAGGAEMAHSLATPVAGLWCSSARWVFLVKRVQAAVL
jgi:hypothetical protein